MDFECRPTIAGDRAAVEAVLRASYARLWAADYPADVLAAVLPYMTSARSELIDCGTYFGVWNDDQLMACGGWTRERPGTTDVTQGVGHIRHVAVHPDWLRRGVGTGLMAHTMRNALDRGISRLECSASLSAKGFYEAIGFEALETVTQSFGPKGAAFDVVLMQHRFAG